MRYLIALAVADLCALYSWNFNLFYKHLINRYQNDLEDSSLIACRIFSFIGFVSLQLSSWYLTLVSLDRCFNIHFLFWHRQTGRAERAVRIILCVTIVIVLINSHLLFFNGYEKSNCQPFQKQTCVVCHSRLNDRYYIFPKWEMIHVLIYNLIPFVIMFISHYFIIRRRPFSSESRYRQRKQRQVTHLLLLVIILFVVLTTPVMIYNVFLRNLLAKRKPLKYIVHGILLSIQYTNHAVSGNAISDGKGSAVFFVLDQFLCLLFCCIEIS